MFIRNAWYVAAWGDEIQDGQILARRICNDPLVLFRAGDGLVAALEDRCCHRAAPLRFGRVTEGCLQCGYHGLTFDRHGKCVRIPAQDLIPERACVRSYPTVERDALVWIWMGDANKADESTIPSFPYHNDEANWPHRHQVIHVKANNMLLVDNLMDLTHIGFVHGRTIGGNEEMHARAQTKVTRAESGLSFIRWMLDSEPPTTYRRLYDFEGTVDRWQEFEFVPPSNIIQWSGAMKSGRGATENRNQDNTFSFRIFHGLTPETESSCYYFWSGCNGYEPDDPAATEMLFSELARTFAEDKDIVEGQQERLTERGEQGLVAVASDAARLHMRRIEQRLLAEEAVNNQVRSTT